MRSDFATLEMAADDKREEVMREKRIFFWIMVGALGILVFWALSLTLNRSDEVTRYLSQGWPPDAVQVMVQNKIIALWHASFMTAVVTVVFALFGFPRFGKFLRFRNWIAAGLVLIVAADAVKLSKHYIKEMPRSYIEANVLTDFLKKNLGNQRVALLTQQGVYGIWVSYLLPYNKIPAFNFSAMPRMPEDYQTFLVAGSKNPLRMWRFAGVKYLLGPTVFEKQLPPGQLRKVFTYDLIPSLNNEFQVIPSSNGTHAIFEFINPIPRYALIKTVDTETDEQALARIADSRQSLLGDQRVPGLVKILTYRPGRVQLKAQADESCMLRVAERWDPDWRAEVDGKPVAIQRIDYLCQGIAIPEGTHRVNLIYSPSRLFFYMQCVGYLILFGSLMVVLIRRRGRHVAD